MPEKVVCVVGPTGCGKTALGVLLCHALNGEVVSADSMQIYRGMTIGTAAPSEEEMDGIPHHMIAIADPKEPWSVARYVSKAVPAIDGILARGRRPVLVGGTGLWMEAAVQGRSFAPGKQGGVVRQELEARLAEDGIAPLLEELRQVDPASAARLHPSDTKRILRALEVWRESGETITAHNAASRMEPPRYDAVWIGLQWRDRSDMRHRIDARVDEMIAAGLLDEVRQLAGRVPPDATAMQGIGYKELLGVLRGEQPLPTAVEEIKLRSRQYAKRQLTWFRRNPRIHWIFWEECQDFPRALQISINYCREEGVC